MRPVRQCVVLVGGLGTRLGSLVADVPKPMLPVAGAPFLASLLREVARYGITDVLLLTGHLSEVVEAALPALEAGLPRPMRIMVSREPVRAGTGGALHHAADRLQDRFLLLNGNSFFDCPLGPLLAVPPHAGVLGHLMLRTVPDVSRYGVVKLEDDRVVAFQAQPEEMGQTAPGVINGGVYVLDRSVLEYVSPQCSLEQDVLPGLAASGRLRGTLAEGWFIDIGIPADLARAQHELPARLARRALLLDRDGVCNVDHGWVGTRDRFEWVPGALDAIVAASRLGWHVFVVTNQSGVARGFYTEEDVVALLGWMQSEAMRAGGTIDDVRYCPYHPEAPLETYRRASGWRKPGPGMILDLARAWRLDPADCVMVGDQASDMEAAAAAGVRGHRFAGGNLADFVRPLLAEARP